MFFFFGEMYFSRNDIKEAFKRLSQSRRLRFVNISGTVCPNYGSSLGGITPRPAPPPPPPTQWILRILKLRLPNYINLTNNILAYFLLFSVYCTGLLGSNVVGLLHPCLTHLLFYVSVCSLAPLNHLDAYVACKYHWSHFHKHRQALSMSKCWDLFALHNLLMIGQFYGKCAHRQSC